MSTDLSKITTVAAADQAIKETEEAIARGEAAVIEGRRQCPAALAIPSPPLCLR